MSHRDTILAYAEARKADYQQLALNIHAHPEVSNYEFYACEQRTDILRQEGFTIQTDVAGHRTGFTATFTAGKPGPVIVFLAEYDALAGLGHSCGHNLFGATSALAVACVRQVLAETGGEIRVYGTPGEEGGENGSAKGSFVREGFLKDVDAALCCHPGAARHIRSYRMLGCAPVDIEFWGQAAHAAGAPEKGINALDGLILTYNGINALRQHLPDDVRIHGIIVSGVDAPNTVPDYAKAKFYLRAASAPVLEDVYRKVERIVAGAALMTGAKGRMQPYQNRVENMVVPPLLDDIYAEAMASLGETVDPAPAETMKGSSDVGNISQAVPTIQPIIKITEEEIPGHTEAFKAAACAPQGLASIVLGAKALALTALTLLTDPERLAAIKAQHAAQVQAQ